MNTSSKRDEFGENLYLAGELVEPGTYLRVGSNIRVELYQGGRLPGSLDGHVACYRKLHSNWRDITHAVVVGRPSKTKDNRSPVTKMPSAVKRIAG